MRSKPAIAQLADRLIPASVESNLETSPTAIAATDVEITTPKQRKIDAALDKRGATRDKVAQRIAEGLDAEIVRREIVDGAYVEVRLPDMAMRHKYAELGSRMRGDLKEGVSVGVGVSVKVSEAEEELLKAYRNENLRGATESS